MTGGDSIFFLVYPYTFLGVLCYLNMQFNSELISIRYEIQPWNAALHESPEMFGVRLAQVNFSTFSPLPLTVDWACK